MGIRNSSILIKNPGITLLETLKYPDWECETARLGSRISLQLEIRDTLIGLIGVGSQIPISRLEIRDTLSQLAIRNRPSILIIDPKQLKHPDWGSEIEVQ